MEIQHQQHRYLWNRPKLKQKVVKDNFYWETDTWKIQLKERIKCTDRQKDKNFKQQRYTIWKRQFNLRYKQKDRNVPKYPEMSKTPRKKDNSKGQLSLKGKT